MLKLPIFKDTAVSGRYRHVLFYPRSTWLVKKSITLSTDHSGQKCVICQYIENDVISRARTVQHCAGAFSVRNWLCRCRSPPAYLNFKKIQMGGKRPCHTIMAEKNENSSVGNWLKKRYCGLVAWMKAQLNSFAFGTPSVQSAQKCWGIDFWRRTARTSPQDYFSPPWNPATAVSALPWI